MKQVYCLCRRDSETPFFVEDLSMYGVEIRSVTEDQQRFESHADKLINYIRYWQASGESLKTSERIKTRMGQLTVEGSLTANDFISAASAAYWNGSNTPGY